MYGPTQPEWRDRFKTSASSPSSGSGYIPQWNLNRPSASASASTLRSACTMRPSRIFFPPLLSAAWKIAPPIIARPSSTTK